MGVTNRLQFDPTDADSIASGSSVGALVRSGADGSLIGHTTLTALDWLRTAGPIIDSAGNEVGVTAGALDVNIASGAIADDLANIDIENTQTLVSTIAINVVASALAGRKWLYLANEGNKTLYVGKTGVTTTNGFPLHQGQQAEFRIGAAVAPQIIGRTGSSNEDVRVMELS